jgi:hypothetical protein
MSVAVYEKIYTIRVDETVDTGKWYYSRAGREFDAEKIEKGKKSYFKIDHIHKIPCEYASVIGYRKDIKYVKY